LAQTAACNFSELSILDCDFVFSNVCLIYYIPVSMHVAVTAHLSKMLRKSGQIYKATPEGRRLPERESQLKQEQDQNLLNQKMRKKRYHIKFAS
jgi:hypothetical protein